MKTCFKCDQVKPLSEFYAHSGMLDGHLNKCKECTRNDVRSNRAARLEYYREYDRQRLHTEKREKSTAKYKASDKYRVVQAKKLKKYRKLFPERSLAHSKVRHALRSGKLKRLPCEVCGDEKSQAHHHDYSKPLDVQWLCDFHHREWHRMNG